MSVGVPVVSITVMALTLERWSALQASDIGGKAADMTAGRQRACPSRGAPRALPLPEPSR
ncbi:hypothetical protein GCM10010247_01620 [Streptomyces calvus]|nr:hypothetical protein GCM10010247_01620 [Streptomyces calvus]